jgi:hypothetical protein
MRYLLVAGFACTLLTGSTAATAQVAPSAPPQASPALADAGAAAPDAAAAPKPKPKPKDPVPAQAMTVVNASVNTALYVIIEGED